VSLPDALALRRVFDVAPAGTVGVEDEFMLLDPETLGLAPVAQQVQDRARPVERPQLELPASQLEVASPVARGADELAAPVLAARRRMAELCRGLAVPAAAAVHPFSPGAGELNRLPQYGHTFREYGGVAARQLVCASHVHVAVGDADTALAVYNAARGRLPLLAALAANGPVYEGADTGLASVRPELCALLPRQGIPPPLRSWDELAGAYRWGARSGAFPSPRTWWWELRLHPRHGTLEFRVPDAQSTVSDLLAIAALVQTMVLEMAARHRAGEPLGVPDTWRIEQNRWSACRHGTRGVMGDLRTGAPAATSELIAELLGELAPRAEQLGSSQSLEHARRLLAHGGADGQRQALAAGGPQEVARQLVARFLEPPSWASPAPARMLPGG
jgi:carboxylate-amine ligase